MYLQAFPVLRKITWKLRWTSHDFLIDNKAATFLMQVDGDSMRDAGILDGDLLVVDRSAKPDNGCVVVVAVNGEYTVKRLRRGPDCVWLEPANSRYQPIPRLDWEKTFTSSASSNTLSIPCCKPMSEVFGLIDCNNFYVSCERVFRPDLEGKPVIVLSNNDGCCVARSQEVKNLGVLMARPCFQDSGPHQARKYHPVQF